MNTKYSLCITKASGKLAAGITLISKLELFNELNGIEFIKSLSPFFIILCKFSAVALVSIFLNKIIW